ncbi:hypothetical protein AB0L39_35215 [Streptomyces parvus]|uniref:hypothetical protein n=1 Tax=Streptomyces parvus TaxID=66428 RepID=UPI00344A5980
MGPHRYGRRGRIAPPRELDSGDRDGVRALVGRMAVELRAHWAGEEQSCSR